jgi:protein-S-isoprenylcysteine O-methyltransferase Ste14
VVPASDKHAGATQRAIVFAAATRTKTTPMPKYLGALTIVLLLAMVLTRVFLLKRRGIKAMKFGSTDKTDFLLPPVVLFYFYVLFAAAFDWPNIGVRPLFHSEAVAWTGVLFCLAGLLLLLWSLMSFRQSFRIGIDTDHPDKPIVDGVFAFSRNPIYVAFVMILIGEFLIFPYWISLIFLVAAAGLIHRQVLREEDYLKGHYGEAYEQYCHRVRRYL